VAALDSRTSRSKLGYNLAKMGFVSEEDITQLRRAVRDAGDQSQALRDRRVGPRLVPAEVAQKY